MKDYVARPAVRERRREYLAQYLTSELYDASREESNAKQRHRYATDPLYKQAFKANGLKYRNTARGKQAISKYRSRPEVKRMLRASDTKWKQQSPRYPLKTAINNARKRRPAGERSATVDELLAMYHRQRGRCALTGIAMTWAGGQKMPLPTSISIDRIDNARGYELDNLRLICHAINAFRGRMSDAEMLDMARALVAQADAVPIEVAA